MRADRIKEIRRFKVVSTSSSGKGRKWSKGVIWGGANWCPQLVEEIKVTLKGGTLKGVRRLQVTYNVGEYVPKVLQLSAIWSYSEGMQRQEKMC